MPAYFNSQVVQKFNLLLHLCLPGPVLAREQCRGRLCSCSSPSRGSAAQPPISILPPACMATLVASWQPPWRWQASGVQRVAPKGPPGEPHVPQNQLDMKFSIPWDGVEPDEEGGCHPLSAPPTPQPTSTATLP